MNKYLIGDGLCVELTAEDACYFALWGARCEREMHGPVGVVPDEQISDALSPLASEEAETARPHPRAVQPPTSPGSWSDACWKLLRDLRGRK